ncbi:S-methyl-5-thioribose-1-phosphate isomerase [Thiopseudomonas alkaliphila]|uniref:Methylthioribose-1-phosphate isomerase n=1 Tax=Thiopseudomonas alkaliphila TaxID=1697053 RepID=A0AAW7DTP4_9GAMM|nr:S-methyl-5-thioribose-1-phosphate isomerase [Thiopseudomonas alkaliphila]MDM1696101.1 S-methyl-5-thioribose-1-phosphate isomerase [Thiopseudomonas alkaliphila]
MREKMLAAEQITALKWQDKQLWLLDQRVLPLSQSWLSYQSATEVAQAISDMVVRGAPAIGIAAAYGVLLSVQQQRTNPDWKLAVAADIQQLAASRPTAVNLFWALEKMQAALLPAATAAEAESLCLTAALGIHQADREANLRMAELGLQLIQQGCDAPQQLLTHCNTGALATGGFGTALGVIRAAYHAGLVSLVHVDETRPWLQGSRLTAWELAQEQLPVSLNIDGAAAHLLREGDITWVIVGADRITAAGDVANKIGTYALAVLARYHDVKFMVVAPSSTIDMSIESGADIPIEQRAAAELLQVAGQPVAAAVPAFNPVFDVTPAKLIDAIVTELGVVEQPNLAKMQVLMGRTALH